VKKILLGLSVLLLSACGGPYNLDSDESTTAELGARDYADKSQADFLGCSGIDSEPDGYVTCEIRDRQTRISQKLTCSYRNKARGCKSK
jgi:hypothetical protein